MPVVETRIQHEYVMKFFSRPESEGRLGYQAATPNIVSDNNRRNSIIHWTISFTGIWNFLVSVNHTFRFKLLLCNICPLHHVCNQFFHIHDWRYKVGHLNLICNAGTGEKVRG